MFVHLIEAIFLNLKNFHKYMKQSKGRSILLSTTLITSEIFSLPIALLMDIWALKIRAFSFGKIQTGKNEFISMKVVKGFNSQKHPPVQTPTEKELLNIWYKITEDFIKIRNFQFSQKNDASNLQGNLNSLITFTYNSIKFLEKYPSFFCMSRHLLESYRRMIERFSQELNQEHLSNYFSRSYNRIISSLVFGYYFTHIKLHVFAFSLSLKIDQSAFPLQAEGIQILENDLPTIPSIL